MRIVFKHVCKSFYEADLSKKKQASRNLNNGQKLINLSVLWISNNLRYLHSKLNIWGYSPHGK